MCAVVLCWGAQAFARDVPPLHHRLTDLCGVVPPPQARQIEQMLYAYEMRTGRQFTVLLVPDLDDEPIEAYALRVAEAWKLGRKRQDDGLLLLIAQRERRARIEVGYGLEADITDALSVRVIHEVLRPALQQKAYGAGIERALTVLMQAADKAPVEGLLPKPAAEADDDFNPYAVGLLLLLLVAVLSAAGPSTVGQMLLLLLSSGGGGGRGRGGGDDDNYSGGGGKFGGGGASGGW
jgi:uncharacterized protein